MSHTGKPISRREMLRWLAVTGAGAALTACSAPSQPQEQPTVENSPASTAVPPTTGPQVIQPTATTVQAVPSKQPESPQPAPTNSPASVAGTYLGVARGEDPAAITELALKTIGGIERFVKSGFDVIIKPNICTDYYPFEYAATTNPVVVATLVRLALGAGAKRVRVMDSPFGGTAESAYATSGIAEAVKAVGGEMELMNPNKFKVTAIPQGLSIQEWEVYQEVLNCDLFIDVPIAKHHNMSTITVGGKNLLGVIQRRSGIHADMGQRIADLISLIRPGLTVVDAMRTLMDHGPTGGNLDDVKINNTVIASHDVVAADSYAATLFGLTAQDVPYIQAAGECGLGVTDLSTIKIEEVSA